MSRRHKRLARLNGAGAQYGALPWRREAQLQVMLVTSRETRRWTIPKGWPVKRLAAAEAAALEAHEEAGVVGRLAEPIGTYRYNKRLRDGTVVICTVTVFPLEVDAVDEHWPEEAERERAWFSPEAAADLVDEHELKALLHAFDPLSAT